jgi:hypothetical protein
LGDRQLALGGAKSLVHVPGGEGLLDGVRVGDADVFVREADQAAGHEQGVLAAVEHAGEPVQGRVGVGAAHRLVERGDQVVVALLRLVVQRGALLDVVGERGGVQGGAGVWEGLELFGHVEEVAAVAVGHGDQGAAGVVVQGQPVADEVFGTVEECGQGGFVEAFEDEDLGAGEEGAVEFEARVLRGGADQGDRAVLDVGQEAVLLGAVEAVDLVDEQQGALPDGAPAAGGGEDLAQVGHAGEGGRHRFEGQVAAVREEAGDGRLPHAGRTPQDGGAEALRRDHATQRGVRGQEVVLPDDLIQLGGAQAVGEWPGGLLVEERQGRFGRFHRSLGSQAEVCGRGEPCTGH